MIHSIVIFTSLRWLGSDPTISPRYACGHISKVKRNKNRELNAPCFFRLFYCLQLGIWNPCGYRLQYSPQRQSAEKISESAEKSAENKEDGLSKRQKQKGLCIR